MYKQTVCLHFELQLYFLKYDVLSEYLTLFWFAMLLNEYEIEFMFRKIRNIRNLGNVYIRGSSAHIVMSRTDVQNGLDFHFKYCYLQFNVTRKIEKFLEIWSLQIVRKGIWPCPPCHDASQCLL